MVSTVPTSQTEAQTTIVYPSSDGEPVAETFVHLYAMLVTIEVLTQYLQGQRATVLGNQFMYYNQGFPRMRVAPDVMVIFGVEPGGRDNYKIWEEGEVPSVVFEMTSQGTRSKDEVFKKTLYAQLGVKEYWLFDPKNEWLEPALQGYRLRGEDYEPIKDGISEPLKLRLVHEEQLIGFYRQDNDERLLIPSELAVALKQEAIARQQAERRADEERQRAEAAEQAQAKTQQKLEQLQAKLQELGINPENIDGD
ncbi:Uma2 family endonuclease [Leptothoe spongobia]|uniref:Uma2 family endonuclease n=1 Tax=Leptothoe spongobia TAU-MAC 1115 TaxID=1967444 RepID=A0A947DF06_9CYAN|nr:Uma2 family endonuclease [Leptothoe spongobia]MBT9315555.1 Uma2 family endonuclease [Leptothoe spongobia TAU-MAC 1115]